jgi:hypothetical protein
MPRRRARGGLRLGAMVALAAFLALLLPLTSAFAGGLLSGDGDFGTVTVGDSSSHLFTYTNTDLVNSAYIGPGGVQVSGSGFSKGSDACRRHTLAPNGQSGDSCTVYVTFSPGSAGSYSGSLTITDSVNGSTSALLSGYAIAPGISLSPSSINFGSVTVGQSSDRKAITLSSTGNLTLVISSISVSGDFSLQHNKTCPTSYDPGSSCTYYVSFKPSATGTRTGSFSVSSNAPSSPDGVSLSGSGVAAPVATAKVSPSSLTFGSQRKGTTSASQSVKLSNTGNASLSISSISASGDFFQTHTCGGSLAAGASCTISVAFRPSAAGTRTGTLSIVDSVGTQRVSLSGIGTVPELTITPISLDFGKTGLDKTGDPKTVKVTNSGTDRMFIQNMNITGDFRQTNTCQPYVNPGISCTISVYFIPKSAKKLSGVLTIVYDLGTATIQLSGIGVQGGPGKTPPPLPSPTNVILPLPSSGQPSPASTAAAESAAPSRFVRFILMGGVFVLLLGLVLMVFLKMKSRVGVPEPETELEAAALLGEPDVEGEYGVYVPAHAAGGNGGPVPTVDGEPAGDGAWELAAEGNGRPASEVAWEPSRVAWEPAPEEPEEPAAEEPEEPEEPAAEEPEEPAAEEPEQPAAEEPEQPAAEEPEEPEQPAAEEPEQPAADEPEEPTSDRPRELVPVSAGAAPILDDLGEFAWNEIFS